MAEPANTSPQDTGGRAERVLETLLFRSRWLLAPFYYGLILILALLVIKFFQELALTTWTIFSMSYADLILQSLILLDLVFAANLIVIVIFSGYENFVSQIDAENMRDRPSWMGKIDFSGLKLKLIGSIVAISGIHLLKSFMKVETVNSSADLAIYNFQFAWMVGIHMAFVVSAILLALMDYIASRAVEK